MLSLILTGALHEDGLADFFDASSARSRSHFLEISKDPRVGTYGVLALVSSFILKIYLYKDIGAEDFFKALVSVYVFSRTLSSFLIIGNRNIASVSKTGDLINNFNTLGLILNCIPMLLVLYYWYSPKEMLLIIPSFLILIMFRWKMKSMLGGITGDIIGAAQQIMEISFLLTLAFV